MPREYFISTPLLLTPTPLRFCGCAIHLLGATGPSFIEGPSADSIDDAFEFASLLADAERLPCLRIPSLYVQLRYQEQKPTLPADPRKFRQADWTAWAFSIIPIASIPVVTFTTDDLRTIQAVLDSEDALA
jgi:hypothetical protein